MSFIWLDSHPLILSSPFLSSMRVCLLFAWQMTVLITFYFFGRHWMGHWIYHRIHTEQGPWTKFVLETSNSMRFALQWWQFSLSSSLQASQCELFKFLSVIGLTLSKHYGPIVRFGLPLFSIVSLCICGIRCEWWMKKWISYWTSRSILS